LAINTDHKFQTKRFSKDQNSWYREADYLQWCAGANNTILYFLLAAAAAAAAAA